MTEVLRAVLLTGWSWPGALAGVGVLAGLALVTAGLPVNNRPGLVDRLDGRRRDECGRAHADAPCSAGAGCRSAS